MTTINDIELKTTFWNDFSIADQFGLDAVRDTYERTFKEWRENISYAKELVFVLNHKIFQHYEENPRLSEFYTKVYEQANEWCLEYFSAERREKS